MATFCLTKPTIEKFKRALKDGELDPIAMANMTSQQRRTLLEKYVGEHAKDVNALYESKLLLKNQQAGYITWIKKVAGMSPQIKRDLISRVERLDKVLNPVEEEAFLNDLAAAKLGVEVTVEEARIVSDLSEKRVELRKSFDSKTLEWSSKEDRALYGATQVALENYIKELKVGKATISNAVRNRSAEFKADFSENKARAIGKIILDSAKMIADNSVSVVASFDDSLFGRQGIMALLSGHTIIWSRNFAKSFGDIVKSLGGKETTDALLAQIYSDPLYMNGEYQKAKIVDTAEEQYPTSLPERVPILGRLFKASEAAFVNGSLRMRTELYTQLRNQKVAHGIEMSKEEIEGTGRVVNSLLAKGHLGIHGQNAIVRLLMWAPKMLRADLDILSAHSFSDIPKADRVTARWNLIKIVTMAVILNTLASMNGKDQELDPRSSDFLKIDRKYGYLRGIPQIITLMARLMSGEYKNSSGDIIKYEPGFGKQSRLDAVYTFMRGKAPPATGAIYDVLAEEDFQGNTPTFSSILLQKGVPISIQNLIQLSKDPTIDNTFGVIADFFGLNSNLTPQPNIKSQVIPEGKNIKNEDIIAFAMIYAKAIKSDPETAFNRMFTGQRIKKVTNGVVIVERMSLSESSAVKKAGKGNNPQMKLDHTIPLELGGSNEKDNLKLIPTATWSSYTKTENALGKAIKEKKISGKEAQKLIVKFKSIDSKKERDAFGLELRSKYK